MPSLPRFDLRSLLLDAQEFARTFPAVAPMLARPIAEPETERLVEGVTYLAGTLLDKANDFEQRAYERLAERVCPWMLRPIPCATILAIGAPQPLPETWNVGTFRFRELIVEETTIQNARGARATLTFVVKSAEPINDLLSSGISLY